MLHYMGSMSFVGVQAMLTVADMDPVTHLHFCRQPLRSELTCFTGNLGKVLVVCRRMVWMPRANAAQSHYINCCGCDADGCGIGVPFWPTDSCGLQDLRRFLLRRFQ